MESLPLPSYSSVVNSLPRLRGDGMDSDSLKPNTPLLLGSSPPNPPPPRHRNLNSSTKAATIAKTQKPKYVPKEPTKGAVGHLKPRNPQEYNTVSNKGSFVKRSDLNGKSQTSQRIETVSLSENKIVLTPSQEPKIQTQTVLYGNLSLQENPFTTTTTVNLNTNKLVVSSDQEQNGLPHVTSSVQSSLNQRQGKGSTPAVNSSYHIQPKVVGGHNQRVPSSGKSNTVRFDVSHSKGLLPSGKKEDVKIDMVLGKEVPIKSSDGFKEDSIITKGDAKEKSLKEKQDMVAITMSSPPTEEREVEGQSQSAADLHLQSRVDTLTNELEQQVKVNSDLKKLLVASVGDDLHWKMDALVQTKTQLASEIGGYTERLRKDYEELDTLSIQADMWKSKFMATRVLIDQLSTDCDNQLAKNQESERALKHLMQERQELHSCMVETHRYLKLLRDSFDPVYAQRTQSLIPNILELARTTQLLSEAIKTRLLGNMPLLTVALDAGIQNGLTPAEKMAHQILMSDMQPVKHVPGRLSTQHAGQFARFHPHVREEGLHWTCCRNCTGDVYIV